MACLSLRRSPVNPPLFDCRMKRASLTPAYLPWPVIVIESKNPQTQPRSIKCQQWPSGRAAADRDRARGLNLLTADSTTNSPVLSLATDDSKPLISMSYCYVEAVERMARKSWSFHSFSIFDVRLRRGQDGIYVGNDNERRQ